jgi:hypothetical protein
LAEGRYRGLWFRLRGSYLDDGPIEAGEVRVIINYDIPILGREQPPLARAVSTEIHRDRF